MICPACTSRTKRITVHDDVPFAYHECCECGWDDYDEQAIRAVKNADLEAQADALLGPDYILETGDDYDELEENC